MQRSSKSFYWIGGSVARLLLCIGQCDRSPGRRGRRDKLIFPVRETRFEIRLKSESSRADKSRSIFELRPKEVLHSLPVRAIRRRPPTGVKRIQSLPGTI